MVDFLLIFTISLIGALTTILIKMGTTIKYEEIDIKHPKLFLNVFCHQYIVDPIIALLITISFKPRISQVYGMFVVAVTPATGTASVTTYTVNGDVSLAIALSMASLVQSIIFTPLVFTALVKLYNLITDRVGNNNIILPFERMFGLMCYVLLLVGIGYKVRQKFDSEKVDKMGLYFQRTAIFLMIIALISYLASLSYIESMTSSNPYTFYGAMLLKIFGQLSLAYIPICNIEEKKKDAIVLVSTRRSPGLALAIAALSFENTEYYGDVIAWVMVYGLIRDTTTMPYLMGLRKRRLGYYCYKKKTDSESDSESDSKTDVNACEIELESN